MKDYRKYYIEETGKNIPKDFEIHHIDANRKNNKIENFSGDEFVQKMELIQY